MKFVDIKNDIAFRKIFGNENKKEILISFLNAVLKLEGNEKICSVTILNPFQLPELYQYKTTVIDVKATDQNNNYYIIEMQVADKGNFDKRIQYYTSKAYGLQIVKGDNYHLLNPTIFVGILNFNFLESTTYVTKHVICNPNTKERVLKDFEYNFIELLKFKKEIKDCITLVDKWIYFIKNAENLEIVPDDINDNGLKEAYHDADQMTWTQKEIERYDYAKMRERDAIEEREKAIKNAVESAVEKAFEDGVDSKTIEIAKKCINQGLPNDLINKLTDISIDFIEKIRNE